MVDQKNKKRKKILVVIGIVLICILSIFLILAYLNYLPFFLKPIKPIGNVEEKPMDSYIEKYPLISEIPNLDKIEKNFYDTDENSTSIVEFYKQKLSDEGYSLRYEDTIQIEGTEFTVLGFTKGVTAVGILISTNDSDGSEVIYTTGNAVDFLDILEWYQNQ
ncbi:MAG: hypothetical protein JSV67_04815 [Thermoplasmatales archaeon]|nr:MAG: hypothetical protein JSV67_04815 [Thermoplasmatales archaeon]